MVTPDTVSCNHGGKDRQAVSLLKSLPFVKTQGPWVTQLSLFPRAECYTVGLPVAVGWDWRHSSILPPVVFRMLCSETSPEEKAGFLTLLRRRISGQDSLRQSWSSLRTGLT